MADDKTLEERVAALEAQAAEEARQKDGKAKGRAEAERRFGKRDAAA